LTKTSIEGNWRISVSTDAPSDQITCKEAKKLRGKGGVEKKRPKKAKKGKKNRHTKNTSRQALTFFLGGGRQAPLPTAKIRARPAQKQREVILARDEIQWKSFESLEKGRPTNGGREKTICGSDKRRRRNTREETPKLKKSPRQHFGPKHGGTKEPSWDGQTEGEKVLVVEKAKPKSEANREETAKKKVQKDRLERRGAAWWPHARKKLSAVQRWHCKQNGEIKVEGGGKKTRQKEGLSSGRTTKVQARTRQSIDFGGCFWRSAETKKNGPKRRSACE